MGFIILLLFIGIIWIIYKLSKPSKASTTIKIKAEYDSKCKTLKLTIPDEKSNSLPQDIEYAMGKSDETMTFRVHDNLNEPNNENSPSDTINFKSNTEISIGTQFLTTELMTKKIKEKSVDLKRIIANANNLEGTHTFSINEILSDSFFLEHSKLNSLDDFLEMIPSKPDSSEELNSVDPKIIDEVVCENTDFYDWHAMTTKALEIKLTEILLQGAEI